MTSSEEPRGIQDTRQLTEVHGHWPTRPSHSRSDAVGVLPHETSETPRHQAFRRVLAQESGPGADAPAIAAGARRLCEHIVQELTPLIGASGVAAVHARGVHLGQQEFPWLAAVHGLDQGDGFFTSLETCMAQQPPAVATDAAVKVLVAVVELLASLIGLGLTTSLLHEGWPTDFPRDTAERVP
jgi:hypothetical protein